MPTPTDFKNRFIEFDTVADARVQIFLDDASLIVTSKWNTLQDIGTLYLAAHYLSVANITASGSTSSPKNISSKSVEGVSVSYASDAPTDPKYNYYNSTSYGKRYLELLMKIKIGAGATLV